MDILRHPALVQLEESIEAERRALAQVMESLAHAEQVEGPWLRARYDVLLGGEEVALLRLRAKVAGRRQELDALSAVLNRGERLSLETLKKIEDSVRRALEDWWRELARRENEVRLHERWLSSPGEVSAETRKEVKRLYRLLVRRLHPDAVGSVSEAFAHYWDEIQTAYRQASLDRLQLLAALVEVSAEGEPLDTLERLVRERERLKALGQKHLETLAAKRRVPPLCLALQLDDPAWVQGRQQAIAEERRRLVAEEEMLEGYLQGLRGGLH